MDPYSNLALSFLKDAKNQRMIILVLSGLIAFALGYNAKHCPPKNEVCFQEMKARDKYFANWNKCKEDKTKELNAQRDKSDKECKVKIQKEIDKHEAESQIVDCEKASALYKQCKRRKLIR
jgi:hypothetical protein